MLARSLDLRQLRTAIMLDPANPELYRRLGQAYLYLIETLDPEEGVKCFRRATELNPRVASTWADLGLACDLVRDTVCADKAFENAVSLDPMTPDLYWVIGNHYMVTRRGDVALAYFRRLLELSPRFSAQTFAICLRAWDDPKVIFRRVLPSANKDPGLRLAFISFLCARGKPEYAYQFWRETAANTSRFSFSLVHPYLDQLLNLGRHQEIAGVWRDLEQLGVVPKPASADRDNLIYNGDFEQPPLNSGMDWQFKKQVYLDTDFADPAAYRGLRCLRIDFTVGRNEEYEPVRQILSLASDQTYELMTYVRSEDITSDSGPRLRVVDPSCSECLNASSDMTLGTTNWHPVSLRFTTGAKTRIVQVSVWRPRSRTFPAEISGRFWMDAASLVLVNSSDPKTTLAAAP
jgi:tetratricopeptide (TPR) repeat protein